MLTKRYGLFFSLEHSLSSASRFCFAKFLSLSASSRRFHGLYSPSPKKSGPRRQTVLLPSQRRAMGRQTRWFSSALCALLVTSRVLAATDLVFETAHPYLSGMTSSWTLAAPTATTYSISFSENTALEPRGKDYIQFFRDSSMTVPLSHKLSGGQGWTHGNYPGVAGKKPLLIKAPTVFLRLFHGPELPALRPSAWL